MLLLSRRLARAVSLWGVVGATLCCCSSASAIVIDPDLFSPGTDVSTAIPGVTLRDYDETGGLSSPDRFGPVYALTSSFATTGTLVFGHSGNAFVDSDVWAAFTPTHRASLWMDFDDPIRFFSIDAIADTAGDHGWLQYFGSSGELLGHVEQVIPTAGEILNLSVSRETADIYRVLVQGADTPIVFDNAVAIIPEPSTALLLGIGLAGLGMRRRRARRGC